MCVFGRFDPGMCACDGDRAGQKTVGAADRYPGNMVLLWVAVWVVHRVVFMPGCTAEPVFAGSNGGLFFIAVAPAKTDVSVVFFHTVSSQTTLIMPVRDRSFVLGCGSSNPSSGVFGLI